MRASNRVNRDAVIVFIALALYLYSYDILNNF
jgi:hypothetical protein